MQSAVGKICMSYARLWGRCKNAYVRGKGKIFAMLLNSCFRRPRADVKRVNPNVANLLTAKTAELAPEHDICALASRRSRTVNYASTCPRLRQAASDAPWRVFSRYRFATLGSRIPTQMTGLREDSRGDHKDFDRCYPRRHRRGKVIAPIGWFITVK